MATKKELMRQGLVTQDFGKKRPSKFFKEIFAMLGEGERNSTVKSYVAEPDPKKRTP
ncbi:hypothetical protein HY493_05845 [Candidatus Woesearchaeota archaeon]|nr:hypothetical protein [Candidatus Woesearchaeota archaeon]